MKNEKAIELLEYMKTEENFDALCDLCDTALAALHFQNHFDILKEFQHLEEVVRCTDCYYNSICAHTVSMVQYSHNTISAGTKKVEFCSYGKRRDDDGKE